MWQGLSVHEEFVIGIQKFLKTKGVKLRRTDFVSFFKFLQDIRPWFPQKGIID